MTLRGGLSSQSSEAQAINTAGVVAGAGAVSGFHRAFRDIGGVKTDLGTLGGVSSYSSDINDAGWIAGYANIATGHTRAFRHNGSTMQNLGTLGGLTSFGQGINAAGHVVGRSTLAGDTLTRAFLHDGIAMVSLGTLGGNYSAAEEINAAGQIVGATRRANNSEAAFLYTGSTMHDLNTLIADTDPLHGIVNLTEANAINDAGQIVAFSKTTLRTYLLTPIPPPQPPTTATPEPATLALFGIGLLGLAAVRRRAA
jgi:probable HAF family extracellular repeat protein